MAITRSMACEYSDKGITVNTINPGAIMTPLLVNNVHEAGATVEDVASVYPVKRVGQPSEIAEMALFLASDKCRFLTGEWINIDGGVTIQGAWAGST